MEKENQTPRPPPDESGTRVFVRVRALLACAPLALWSCVGLTGVTGKFVDEARPALFAAAIGAVILGYIGFKQGRGD